LHTWENLKADFKGGKVIYFKVGIQVHDMIECETNLHEKKWYWSIKN
jgi:hypothetical protein